jgi:hypothetical protein
MIGGPMSRVKPKEFWEKHVEKFRKSKMSQRAYSRAHGLKHRTLQYHLNKKRPVTPETPHTIKGQSGWLPMIVTDEPAHSACTGTIRLQISRVTIETERGFDNTHLMNIFRAAGVVC